MYLIRAPRHGRSLLSVPITSHFGLEYAMERAAMFVRDFPDVTLFEENQFGKLQAVPEWISQEEARKLEEQKKNKKKINAMRHN